MASEYQPRCPFCGKYQSPEADGYYGKLDPDAEFTGVEIFCNEDHYDKYQWARNRVEVA